MKSVILYLECKRLLIFHNGWDPEPIYYEPEKNMNKSLLLAISIFLSACSQPNQNKQMTASEKVESKVSQVKPNLSVENKVIQDLPIATFAFQQEGDQFIAKNCIWTDAPRAEGKNYWAILLSNEINGKSKFTKEELQSEKVKIGKPIKNCNGGSEDENQKYSYEIDREGDLVNFVSLKNDRIVQNSDHTFSIDLNKNGTPEQIYVCYNMESLDAFFIEPAFDHPYLKRVNVQLSYAIDGEIDEELQCGNMFYKKNGIIAKEDPKTGEYIYSVK